MKKTSVMSVAIAAVAILWAAGAQGAIILVDHFTTAQSVTSNGTSLRTDGAALGGTRQVRAYDGSGDAHITTSVSAALTGFFSVTSSPAGDLSVQWGRTVYGFVDDGLGNPIQANMSKDLVDGTNTFFLFNWGLGAASGYTVEMTAKSTWDGSGTLDSDFGGVATWTGTSLMMTAPFVSFTNASGAINWGDVDYLDLTIHVPGASNGIALDAIYASTPEPSSLSLLGLCALVGALHRRRRS